MERNVGMKGLNTNPNIFFCVGEGGGRLWFSVKSIIF